MQTESATLLKLPTKDLMDLIIRVGVIAFIVVMCVRIFAPFANLMLWALILAVCLYPLHLDLAKRLGGRHGRAAIFLVVAVLLLIGVPTVVLGSSFASHIDDLYSAFSNNTITVGQPDPSVADWPVIGKTVHRVWSSAANDMPAFMEELQPQFSELVKYALSMAADTAGSVMFFLVSVIIAGFTMTHGESGSRTTLRIFERLSGPSKGPRMYRLATATFRSVAMGVIGVAFVQALLLGVGFILAGIPAAGILAMIALLFGIARDWLPVVVRRWLNREQYRVHGLSAGRRVCRQYPQASPARSRRRCPYADHPPRCLGGHGVRAYHRPVSGCGPACRRLPALHGLGCGGRRRHGFKDRSRGGVPQRIVCGMRQVSEYSLTYPGLRILQSRAQPAAQDAAQSTAGASVRKETLVIVALEGPPTRRPTASTPERRSPGC